MENQFWAVGCWSGLNCGIKGFGPIMSNFFGCFFFNFSRAKKLFYFIFLHFSVRTEKLHKIKLKFKKKKKF